MTADTETLIISEGLRNTDILAIFLSGDPKAWLTADSFGLLTRTNEARKVF